MLGNERLRDSARHPTEASVANDPLDLAQDTSGGTCQIATSLFQRNDRMFPVRDAELAEVLKTVPRGALALAGTALAILLIAWLYMYFFVFLPRGPIS